MVRNYLVELREKRNESQQDVADALGLSRQYYAMIENGTRQRKMDIFLVTSLANHFKLPVSKIVELEQKETESAAEA